MSQTLDTQDIIFPLIAGAVGFASGFQGIHKEYPDHILFAAFRTGCGFLYLLTRFAIPCAAYVCLINNGLLEEFVSFKGPPLHPFYKSLVLAVCVEGVLRSKFFVRNKNGEEVLSGPFNLLSAWEAFLLEQIDLQTEKQRAIKIEKVVPQMVNIPFYKICDLLVARSKAIKNKEEAEKIKAEIKAVHDSFDKDDLEHIGTTEERETKHKYLLAYAVGSKISEHSFQILFSKKFN